MKYKFGVILPNTLLFGGVRRFFVLGNLYIEQGHSFVIFSPDGAKADWIEFRGVVDREENISRYDLDALFITETKFINSLLRAKAKLKIFYHVGPRALLHTVVKHPEIRIFVNSTGMYEMDKRKYGIEPFKAIGGVHLPEEVKLREDKEFVVMAYGRLSRKGKGTALVVKACEQLYKEGFNVKLLLFDTPIDERSRDMVTNFNCRVPFEFVVGHPVERNFELFQRASVFVSAEKKGGWSNTSAEALASGIPLIATKVGTKDFLIDGETGLLVWRFSFFIKRAIKKLILDHSLRRRIAVNGRKKIEQFSWINLADTIVEYVQQHTADSR